MPLQTVSHAPRSWTTASVTPLDVDLLFEGGSAAHAHVLLGTGERPAIYWAFARCLAHFSLGIARRNHIANAAEPFVWVMASLCRQLIRVGARTLKDTRVSQTLVAPVCVRAFATGAGDCKDSLIFRQVRIILS